MRCRMDELNPTEDGAGPKGILSPPVSLWVVVVVLVLVGVLLLITVVQTVTRTLWFLFLTTNHLGPKFGHLLPFSVTSRANLGWFCPILASFHPN